MPPRSSHRPIVALGSNLGDRERYLRLAVAELGGVVAQSQVFETDPIGGPDEQGAYLNMVVVVETPLDPFAFLRRCQHIEAAALRQRIVHWGPRTLDVDMLFYDDVTIIVARADDPAPAVTPSAASCSRRWPRSPGALPAGLGRRAAARRRPPARTAAGDSEPLLAAARCSNRRTLAG